MIVEDDRQICSARCDTFTRGFRASMVTNDGSMHRFRQISVGFSGIFGELRTSCVEFLDVRARGEFPRNIRFSANYSPEGLDSHLLSSVKLMNGYE